MLVRVLFFGMLKELAGRSSESLTVSDQATAGDVLAHYAQQIPSLHQALSSIAISVNQQYAHATDKLRAGDEIGLLPPVSGGSDADNGRRAGDEQVAIVEERIDTAEILARIKRPEDGAVVTFEGIVRNHTRNRRTLFLEYEAYREMALKQLHALCDQARSQFQVREVAIIHRLGRLEIGETSVLIVVGSAHRGAAFEACRWLIDTLKRTVPIWKKEYFEDGAVWADGEPFPEQLTSATIPETVHPTK